MLPYFGHNTPGGEANQSMALALFKADNSPFRIFRSYLFFVCIRSGNTDRSPYYFPKFCTSKMILPG